jgi:eight-cysteine-cluster-containing protein
MLKKIILFSLLILLVLTIYLFLNKEDSDFVEITNFEDCVSAGYPVMESYPRQCSVPDGGHFVEEFPAVEEYYGSSSFTNCESSEECFVSGCNGEVCGGVDDEGFASICVVPDMPLPKDLGYSCGCFESKCQWSKD